MLINATRATTTGHTPPELLDIYVRYKQGTRVIIAWLTRNSSTENKTLHTVSIRDLVEHAQVVRSRKVPMPDVVDFEFRETITARTQLSKYFRNEEAGEAQNVETTNHEYFTTCLTKIYVDLCECRSKAQEEYNGSPSNSPAYRLYEPQLNRFAMLSEDLSYRQERLNEQTATTQCTSYAKSLSPSAPCSKDVPRLVDDQLGDACELCREFEQISGLVLSTNEVWEKAAHGEVPLVVATSISNAAYAAFEKIEQRLQTICESLDLVAMRGKILHLQPDGGLPVNFISTSTPFDTANSRITATGSSFPTGSNVVLASSSLREVESLQIPWDLLLQCKRNKQTPKGDKASLTAQESSQIILRRGTEASSADRECVAMLLRDIEHHASATRRSTSLVRLSTPLYAEIGDFLSHNGRNINVLRCCFGLRLLLESYKSYLLAAPGPDACPSCRLQALRLAQEAAPSVLAVLNDSTMPCRCYHTLAFHLENLHKDLEIFLKENTFDLYFQAPWVSGSHSLEMLETLFYYGLRLFSYRHIVGAVCHVYQALRACTQLDPIPLLEELCTVFNHILFPGGRPQRSFKASFIRYKGGRLRFNPRSSEHKSGNHRMVIPAHTARASAGFGLYKEANDPRFEYRKICLFHHVKEKGYHLDDSLWTKVYAPADIDFTQSSKKDTNRNSCNGYRRIRSRHNYDRDPPQHRLSQLEKAILRDFAGPLPVAKMNFFKIYLVCVRIVSIISDTAHGEEDKGLKCMCFVDAVLGAADRFKADEHKLQPFGCKQLVETCGGAMKEALGEREVADFLWSNV